MKTVDIASVLDEGRWSAYQKLLVAGTALAIILDGMDNQLLGNVIPALMKEWSLPRAPFTTVLALGPLGMILGGTAGGVLGDRIGRRTALVCSVLAFAVPTLAIATVDGVTMLGVFRFLAGLGLGGAMPNAAALASEYVPRRQRPFAVTLTIVCIPLGGTLAALFAGQVLPRYGWRALFVIGGLLPLLIAVVLFKLLPESPQYLAIRRERWPELVALLRRFGQEVGAESTFVVPTAAVATVKPRASIRAALRAGAAPRHARPVSGLLLLPARQLHRLQLDRRDADRRGLRAGRRQQRAGGVQFRRRRRRGAGRAGHSASRLPDHVDGHVRARGRQRARDDRDAAGSRRCRPGSSPCSR